MKLTYESYLSYMEHINWKQSDYRVMTEEEFLIFMDWYSFVKAHEQFTEEELTKCIDVIG